MEGTSTRVRSMLILQAMRCGPGAGWAGKFAQPLASETVMRRFADVLQIAVLRREMTVYLPVQSVYFYRNRTGQDH